MHVTASGTERIRSSVTSQFYGREMAAGVYIILRQHPRNAESSDTCALQNVIPRPVVQRARFLFQRCAMAADWELAIMSQRSRRCPRYVMWHGSFVQCCEFCSNSRTSGLTDFIRIQEQSPQYSFPSPHPSTPSRLPSRRAPSSHRTLFVSSLPQP